MKTEKKISLETVIDNDTQITIGDLVHLEVEHTLSKLGILKTYSEDEAAKILDL